MNSKLQGDFSIFYVETTLSSFKGRLASLHWFSALSFVCKLDGGVRRHDCVNCTHLPDICRVLSVLQVQILDPYFISDRENADGKTFGIPLWFCFVPPLSFHRHSIFILCYLFYVLHREKSSNHFIPVKVIIYSLYHPRIVHKIMYSMRKLFILCRE